MTLPFTIYKGGRRPAYPDFYKPRIWADDFAPSLDVMRDATADQTADWASLVTDWPMDLNGPDPSNPPQIPDGIGDCGIAGMDHLQLSDHAYGDGNVRPWSTDTLLGVYHATGGYVLGDESTDNGTNLQDNLQFWKRNTIEGDQILAYAALRPGSWFRAERVYYQQVFGSLYLGHNWPQSAEQQAQDGEPFTVIPGSPSAGGHCTTQAAELNEMDEVRLPCWGALRPATRGFFMATVEEAWVVITQATLERNGSNQYGYDMQAMNQAISSLTGQSNPLKLKTIK